MKRREFISTTAAGLGAAWLGTRWLGSGTARVLAAPTLTRKFAASDTVVLGSTGIRTSRLAMGTGTVGVGHHSHQTALGVKGLSDLLLNGYDHGLRFFDAADSYGSHPHVAEALKHVSRDFLGGAFAVHAPGLRGSNRLRIGLGAPLGGSDPRFCSIGGDCASYRLRQDDRERPDPRPWIYTEASIGERAIARTEPICLFAGCGAFCGRAAVVF